MPCRESGNSRACCRFVATARTSAMTTITGSAWTTISPHTRTSASRTASAPVVTESASNPSWQKCALPLKQKYESRCAADGPKSVEQGLMNDPDIIKEFLLESHENLDRLDRDLVALEKDPRERERLASIFRTIHTIKGTCGFLGFAQLGAVTHAGENLLGRLRDGQLVLNADITSALLALVDAVRKILRRVETTGAEGEGNYQALITTLTCLSAGTGESPVPSMGGMLSRLPGGLVEGQAPEGPRKHGTPDVEGTKSASFSPASLEAISDSTIRVHVDLLDKLMRLVGELVLTRNQILRFTATQKDSTFLGTCQHLNLITTELQEAVM